MKYIQNDLHITRLSVLEKDNLSKVVHQGLQFLFSKSSKCVFTTEYYNTTEYQGFFSFIKF